MENDLLIEVQTGLAKHKGQWKRIAKEVPEASYSMIAQIGRGKYASEPKQSKLQGIARWLREQRA